MEQSDTNNIYSAGNISSEEKLTGTSASLELKDVCRGFGDEWEREEIIKDVTNRNLKRNRNKTRRNETRRDDLV